MIDKSTQRPETFDAYRAYDARGALDYPHALWDAFIWRNTPQGNLFWAAQCNSLQLTPDARATILAWLGDDKSSDTVPAFSYDELVAALRGLLDSVEYVATVAPDLVGYGVRHERAAKARAILAKLEKSP